jgi:hypothetical protein
MDKKEAEDAARHFMKSNTRWSERLMGIRRSVEDIGRGLDPGDDWMPVVIVDGMVPKSGPLPPGFKEESRGQLARIIVGFASFNPEDKEHAAWVMRAMAVAFQATAMAFVSTVWMSMAPDTVGPGPEGETDEERDKRFMREATEHQEKHGMPSQDPNRIEKLMIISVADGGEDDGFKTAFASIRRFKDKAPSLYDWAIMDDSKGGFLGRFPEAIMEGIKYAAALRSRPEEGEEWKGGEA